MMIEDDITRL